MEIPIYTTQEQFNIELIREYATRLALHKRLEGYDLSLYKSIEDKHEMLHHSRLYLHRLRKQLSITLLN